MFEWLRFVVFVLLCVVVRSSDVDCNKMKNVKDCLNSKTELLMCPYKEISGMSITALCEFDNSEIDCTDNLLPGTKATAHCHTGYTNPAGDVNSELTCLASGQWNDTAIKCEPECGVITKFYGWKYAYGLFGFFVLNLFFKFQNISGTDVHDVPWHVGIYQDDIQICGGTIISERVVISAAHCFSQETNGQHEIDYSRYKVAAGKTTQNLNETEASESQVRDVQEVGISLR